MPLKGNVMIRMMRIFNIILHIIYHVGSDLQLFSYDKVACRINQSRIIFGTRDSVKREESLVTSQRTSLFIVKSDPQEMRIPSHTSPIAANTSWRRLWEKTREKQRGNLSCLSSIFHGCFDFIGPSVESGKGLTRGNLQRKDKRRKFLHECL